MNEISKVFVLPETQEEIQMLAQSMKNGIIEGEACPLLILKKIKALEKLLESVKKDPQVALLIEDEAEKYTAKTFNLHGAIFTRSERGTYEYSQCQDSVLKYWEIERDQLDAKITARKDYLKTLKEATPDMETGEILYPAAKSVKTIISVSLPKF